MSNTSAPHAMKIVDAKFGIEEETEEDEEDDEEDEDEEDEEDDILSSPTN